jgi:flagellar biosynthesis/type III secretory pathway protein FliH
VGQSESEQTLASTDALVTPEQPPAPEGEDAVLLPETAEEVQALIDKARTEGCSAAEEAMSGLKTEIEAEREALVCLMDRIDSARKEWAHEVRSQLGEVLLVGVRQIVSESASLQAEALMQRVAEVGERLVGEQKVILRVPEADVEAARSFLADREGWQVVGDDSLVAGGCIAETDGGKIDATLGAAFSGLSGQVKEWIDIAGAGEE